MTYDMQQLRFLVLVTLFVKERQANVSRKGRRLAKKREDYFFVVEEILKKWKYSTEGLEQE